MPWTTDADVDRHHAGLSTKKKKVWREVANKELSDHGDEARAIKTANAVVGRIKESMKHEQIDLMIQEATKHYVDDSLSNVHSKIQDALSSEHRRNYDSYDYEDYPQLHHIFGDKDKGHAVYKQNGQHYRAPYKMDNGGGGYSLGAPESVQLAYVPSTQSVSESLAEIVKDHPKVGPKVVEFMERFISTKERSQMDSEDFAGKGRSFPISQPGDVRAALDSIGRAGNGNHSPEELKSRILAIAKRKGFPIPKSDQKESKESLEIEETAIFQESGVDQNGNAEFLLISPGRGSMGYYSAKMLQEACVNGAFNAPIRMFLDHQTAQERAARPEGDVQKWAATTTSNGEFKENGKAGPGVYAKGQVYKDFVPFVKERKGELGVSVRAAVATSGRMVEGVQEVAGIKYLISADFVTAAGRGGKVVEMYESFRSGRAGADRSVDAMTEQEMNDFKLLQESNAKLLARLDRQDEALNRITAEKIVRESLAGTGILARGQERITKQVLVNLPVKDGVFDEAAFKTRVQESITEEVTYLQESGVRISPFVVKGNGGDTKQKTEQEVEESAVKDAEKMVSESLDFLMDRPKKGAA